MFVDRNVGEAGGGPVARAVAVFVVFLGFYLSVIAPREEPGRTVAPPALTTPVTTATPVRTTRANTTVNYTTRTIIRMPEVVRTATASAPGATIERITTSPRP